MNARDVVGLAAVGVFGYVIYKIFSSPTESISDVVTNLVASAIPGTSDPSSTGSAIQQFICAKNEVFDNNTGRCVVPFVIDPQTHQRREWQGTEGPDWLSNSWFKYLDPAYWIGA